MAGKTSDKKKELLQETKPLSREELEGFKGMGKTTEEKVIEELARYGIML